LRRKRKPATHVNHERWLVSYADFVTLLFAFFVVLYSSSQVDKRKVGSLALAIQVAFQQLDAFDASNSKRPARDSAALPFAQVPLAENTERPGDFSPFVQPMEGLFATTSATPLQNVQKDLMKALAPEIQEQVVSVSARPEGLVVTLQEAGFYESGSATIRPAAQDAIDRLAAVLQSRGEPLRIEGHTDNVPIHNQHFDSNWELSTARATELVKLFIARYKLDASRLSAAGFAQYHPVALNDTEENRARNRRVDIVILNPARQ
jgi:chemotaxis protein MotB